MPTPRILSVLSLILNLRHLVLSSARGNNIQYLGLRHTARLKHLLELLDENRCHHRTHLDTCSGLDTRDLAQKYLEPPIKKVQLSPLCNNWRAQRAVKFSPRR